MLVGLLHMELVQCIPQEYFGDEEILPVLLTTATMAPYLSDAFSFEEATRIIQELDKASNN